MPLELEHGTSVAVGLAARAAGRLGTTPAAGELATTQARLVAPRTVCALPCTERERRPELPVGTQAGHEH